MRALIVQASTAAAATKTSPKISMRVKKIRAGATTTLRGNSTQTAHGVPRISALAPSRRWPSVARYSATPFRLMSTGGAGTTFDKSVHTSPVWLPISTTAPLPTRRPMTSDAEADDNKRRENT